MSPRRLATAFRAAAGSLAAVLRNRDIRALELAWTLGVAADWALLVVALVVAYNAGGPVLVGLIGLVRMVPATIVNLLVSLDATRRPERALVLVSLVRGAGAALVAGAIITGVIPLAFVGIAFASAAGTLVRPTTLALMPSVAVTPDELVNANVVGAIGESVGTFVGPLAAGAVVAGFGPAPAALLAVLACGAAALVTAGVQVADAARPKRAGRSQGIAFAVGMRELAIRPASAWVMGSFGAQATVRGALNTYLAILAIETLGMHEAGVGLLGAAIGLGGMAGGALGTAAGRLRRLAPLFALALVLWGTPLVVIGVLPLAAVALVAMAVVGIGNAFIDVAGFTLLQRGTSNRARGGVFGVLEVVASGGVSVGGVVGSLLYAGLGIHGALVVTGLSLPLIAVIGWRWVRRLDTEGVVPEHQATLLRGIPLFTGLPMAALEHVASGMREVRFAQGERLMTQGEAGDVFFAIEEGRTRVDIDGVARHEHGPGVGIGEIALLRKVPRTATVTAIDPVRAYSIDRATFLAAVTGHARSAAVADHIVEDRLRGDGDDEAVVPVGGNAG